MKVMRTIVDEVWPTSSTSPLTKKEIGKRRYERQQTRVAHERASRTRTRPSDISPRRITDGIPANHAARAYRRPTPKALPLEFLNLLLGKITVPDHAVPVR